MMQSKLLIKHYLYEGFSFFFILFSFTLYSQENIGLQKINALLDEYKKDKVVNYKINLELTNLETNEIVWIGDKEIKKLISD